MKKFLFRRQPKYCKLCGKNLDRRCKPTRYNKFTGIPTHIQITLECSRWFSHYAPHHTHIQWEERNKNKEKIK